MTGSAVRQEVSVHRFPGAPRWRPLPASDLSSTTPPTPCAEPSPRGRRTPSDGHPAVVARRRRLRARRRRILLATAVVGILVALALPWGGAGRPPLATPGPVLAGAAVVPHSLYIVQPGDTVWGIAERLDPGGDPRPIEAQLEAQVGSDALQPGEKLRLP